jgi:hypothetical protein
LSNIIGIREHVFLGIAYFGSKSGSLGGSGVGISHFGQRRNDGIHLIELDRLGTSFLIRRDKRPLLRMPKTRRYPSFRNTVECGELSSML